jgi:putative ABC transport system permease protein
MIFFARVPLAALTLIHSRLRFIVSILGITFAVVLMFVEFGFLNAMYDSQVELIRLMNADLVILNKQSYALLDNIPFSRRRLVQAASVDGVSEVFPLYLENRAFFLKNPENGRRHIIRVLAFPVTEPVFPELHLGDYASELEMPDTALIDLKSRDIFGRLTPGIESELTGRKIRIIEAFSLGTDFVNDGNLIMSTVNFSRLFPARLANGEALRQVEVGLVKVAPGSSTEQVRNNLQQILPGDVSVYTKAALIEKEKKFWKDNTPIGFTFWLAMALGFIVGVIVCYQILYTGVVDHLPQYGILKAMGFSNSYLVGSVLRQALILSVLGFFAGWLISLSVYDWTAALTGLPMRLTASRFLLVFVLTIGLCVVSGLLAVRKVVSADPAEVF